MMRTFFGAVALSVSQLCVAADAFTVTVRNDLDVARPAETIVVPFGEVQRRLPNVLFDQVVVKDRAGRTVASQVIGFTHSHKGPQQYEQLVFQHDFAPKEGTATFTIEASAVAPRPLEPKVFARYVPERFDDFVWENDRMAHRAYGPALEQPGAGKDQMISSGLDLWTKKVRYPIADRWYHKGHDGLHTDTGEGLDMYEVGMNRGAGGTGIWDGKRLSVSKNWRTWKILANGPIRAIFELGYEPWDAGNGVWVAETKRFTVDAGHNLDEVTSTFSFTSSDEITVAVGISQHTTLAQVAPLRDESARAIGVWEQYKDPADGTLGVGVVFDPAAKFAGFAELPATSNVPRLVRPELLILAKVKSGEALRYYVGGAWDKSGDFTSQQAWEAYLRAVSERLKSPLKLSYAPN